MGTRRRDRTHQDPQGHLSERSGHYGGVTHGAHYLPAIHRASTLKTWAQTVGDVFIERGRVWLRLREKGGKQHAMPAHHTLEECLSAYIKAAGIADSPNSPLFRTIDRKSKTLSDQSLPQASAWEMVNRRAKAAGIKTAVCNHTFRGTGITAYLENGGTLERAQAMAAHASPRTTRLYDRRSDRATLDDVERIRLD